VNINLSSILQQGKRDSLVKKLVLLRGGQTCSMYEPHIVKPVLPLYINEFPLQ